MRSDTKRLIYTEAVVSMVLNTVLFGLKIWAGLVTGSIAIIADAWHTLSDSFTSVVVLLGARASAMPADRDHPFGHGRAELVASVVVGILLAVVGVNFLIESVQTLRARETAEFGMVAAVVFAVSAVSKEAIARYSFWAARKSGYRALTADAWHHRSDAIASLLILIGVFVGRYVWWIDGVLGIAVALLIVYAALDITRDAINPILGERADADLLGQLEALADRVVPEAHSIHHVHVHRYGDHTEITFHLRTDGSRTLTEAHDRATKLEIAIRDALNAEATIHCEPAGEGSE
ncbi:MAG: cation diffusion facilitator family transporter [Spirochaetia bacterium]